MQASCFSTALWAIVRNKQDLSTNCVHQRGQYRLKVLDNEVLMKWKALCILLVHGGGYDLTQGQTAHKTPMRIRKGMILDK